MSKRSNRKRIPALIMAVWMTAVCAAPALAAPIESGPTYDEAYYATLDYYGNLLEGSVVKSYALNGASGLTDYGTYDQVVNLTDGTPVSLSDGRAAFQFDQAPDHFYFEGKTAQPFQELPWTVTLRYYLNGVPARAEALAGEKGVVEIEMDLIPNEHASSYARYNYTLEAMAMFNEDDILSIEAPGAQVQLVGNLRTILFIALPGEEEHFSIRVGSNDFSFNGMTLLMVPATLGQLEEIAKLSQRKDELEEDYRALSGSLDAMLDALNDIQSGLYDSAAGLDRLNEARSTISNGKGSLYDQADTVLNGTDTILDSTGNLLDSAGTILDTSGAVLDHSGNVLDSTGNLLDSTGNLLDSAGTILDASGDVLDHSGNVLDSAGNLLDGLGSLLDSTDVLETDLDLIRDLGTAFRLDLTGLAGQLDTVEQRVQTLSNTVTSSKDTLNELADTAVSLKDQLERMEKALKNLGNGTGDVKVLLQDAADLKESLERLKRALNNASISSVDVSDTSFGQVIALHNAYDTRDETKFFAYLLTAQGQGSPEETAKQMTRLLAGYQQALAGVKAQYPDMSDGDAHNAAVDVLNSTLGRDVTGELTQTLQLHSLFGAKGSSFKEFCGRVLGDTDQAGQLNQLWEVYQKVNEVQGNLGSTLNSVTRPTAAVVGELAGLCGQLDDIAGLMDDAKELTGALQTAVPKLNSALDSLDALRKELTSYEPTLQEGLTSMGNLTASAAQTLRDTEALLGAADTLLGDGRDVASSGKDLMYDTKDVLTDATDLGCDIKDLLSDVRDTGRDTKDVLTDATDLGYDVKDLLSGVRDTGYDTKDVLTDATDLGYDIKDLLSDVRDTGYDTKDALADTRDVLSDTRDLMSGTKDLMQTSGVQLDEAAQQTLRGLSQSLRKTGKALSATTDVKNAKNALADIIEDTWREYTGDINNILMMDAGAQPVSLTDARNPAPSSIQILLRTQEIKEQEPKAEAIALAVTTSQENLGFWGRIAQMFRDFWAAITGIFH